jgi:hypothetical protein
MPVDTAANWMDIVRSDADYDFMKPWHYVDFPKGQSYWPSDEPNIVNRLITAYYDLKHKNVLPAEQVRFDVLVLFHLMGDLHMPLHTAYDDDLGGNKVMIQYDTMKTHNLHRFWDEDIIRLTKITDEDCMQLLKKEKPNENEEIDFVRWMNESRALLPAVYNFPENMISQQYLDANKEIVKKQLLFAGIRLAAILNKLFYDPAPQMDMEAEVKKYKNGININDAMKYVGKTVTVCSRVYGVSATDKITRINLGDRFPNSPLTVVIFAGSYANFKSAPGEFYKDKNICVEGKVEEYRGKAQIIIEKPGDITVK